MMMMIDSSGMKYEKSRRDRETKQKRITVLATVQYYGIDDIDKRVPGQYRAGKAC
jgi:hypothetical protein